MKGDEDKMERRIEEKKKVEKEIISKGIFMYANLHVLTCTACVCACMDTRVSIPQVKLAIHPKTTCVEMSLIKS